MSNENKFDSLLYDLRRNYPQYPSTFGPCYMRGCDESARSSGKCAKCCEKQIGELVKNPGIALLLHSSIKTQARLVSKCLEVIDELDDDD